MKQLQHAPDRIATRQPGSVLCPAVRSKSRPGSQPAQNSRDFRYYVDAQGRQHFNFAQRVWLRASVDMAVTPVLTMALETLAVNLLTHMTRRHDCSAAVGVTSRRVLRLAPLFCSECLLTARAEGWVMPRATIREWLISHARTARRQTR
jgi:hypothetical protein